MRAVGESAEDESQLQRGSAAGAAVCGRSHSLRGFRINAAGPRDLQTGFPVGGTAAFVNTFEFRMPAPTLPFVGDSLNFVLFHDMGNVFQNPCDMFPSFLHSINRTGTPARMFRGSIGTCNFNYFSHDVGLGARYKTPVGPIRLDFSYNLNPPIYPVIYDFKTTLRMRARQGTSTSSSVLERVSRWMRRGTTTVWRWTDGAAALRGVRAVWAGSCAQEPRCARSAQHAVATNGSA